MQEADRGLAPMLESLTARYRAEGRFVSAPGMRLFALEQGQGSAVLFLHGIPTQAYLWRDVMPVVALNHRAIALDLPGFGLSERPRTGDYSVAAQAEAICSALRQLDIARVAIVGHDFGALVAAEILSRQPERCSHLVLLNTSLRQAAWRGSLSPLALLRLPFVGEMSLALSRPWMLKRAMSLYLGRPRRLDDEVMAHYWWPFDHGFKTTLLNLARQRVADHADFERWRSALSDLSIPCLLIWGAADPTFTLAEARDLNALIPAARLQIFAHANHFVPEDSPEATGRLINAFLSGLT